MTFWIVKNAWWMRWADGMVVWPWVWLRLRKVRENPRTEFQRREGIQNLEWNLRIYRHELEHVYQIKKVGRLKFYWRYLVDAVRLRKYRSILVEVEAYAHQDEVLTKKELKWLADGKIKV